VCDLALAILRLVLPDSLSGTRTNVMEREQTNYKQITHRAHSHSEK